MTAFTLLCGWIPCSGALPEIGERCLAAYIDPARGADALLSVGECYRGQSGKWFRHWEGPKGPRLVAVTDWMPLPDPPEKSGKVRGITSSADAESMEESLRPSGQ